MHIFSKLLLPTLFLALTMGCKSDNNNATPAVNAASLAAPAPAPSFSTSAVVTTAPHTTTAPPTTLQLFGANPIASNFDYRTELQTSGISSSAAPDVVGAFRFLCMPGQLKKDDPIVFPGKPGAAHLHQFFGNMNADANSTYASLRASGASSCRSPVNRSAYWMPAMLDGVGSVVRPDYVSIYYKRRPAYDPKCDPAIDARAEGYCIDLPNGLNFVFGFDMVTPANSPTGASYFNCDGPTAKPGRYPDIESAVANCPVGNRLGAVINAPTCWNGKALSTADGRSHVSYASYGSWGYLKCPATHPYVIPAFTMGVWYTVDANLKSWRLSSDAMVAGARRGSTFHADFMMAWDPEVKRAWHDNCINKMLNCSDGVLGNGTQMKQSFPLSWNASPRLVPVPA